MPLFQKRTAKLVYLEAAYIGHHFDSEDEEDSVAGGIDEPDRLPACLSVDLFDLLFYIIAMTTYVVDVTTDCFVAHTHYSEGRVWSGLFVALFCVLPSLILNMVAFLWMLDDEMRRRRQAAAADAAAKQPKGGPPRHRLSLMALACILQVGPLIFYARAFAAARRVRSSTALPERRHHFKRMIAAERDATLLRFFEAYMESAPQVLIQGFILAIYIWGHNPDTPLAPWVFVQTASVLASLLSVSWTVSIQHRTLRISRPDKANMRPHESIMQLLWRAPTVLSRYLVLITFCLAHTFWIVPVFAIHYLISVFHIAALQSVYVGIGSTATEIGLILVNGCIHFFTPFNMAEGRTRARYAVAYTVEAVEGALLFSLCLLDDAFSFPYKTHVAVVSAACFVFGISAMLVYYGCGHPNRRGARPWPVAAADSGASAARPALVSQNSQQL